MAPSKLIHKSLNCVSLQPEHLLPNYDLPSTVYPYSGHQLTGLANFYWTKS